ncbi:MAG: tRNA uridine-5-carboxymethylaminomethyl(34) synthesis GTPase MnmE [Candidatus Rokubacteria bacterium]|nr:tRNA uridine-5-carboxymethylaminomethyl(34) synthesis GTPase MnmE [Candidatus Rokubacteria bacterium]
MTRDDAIHSGASAGSPDTIVGIATAAGPSAVGIVRLSGPGAINAAGRVVRAPALLGTFASHKLRRVAIVDPGSGEALDDALCVVMHAPRSYTGEDVVEIHTHGSPGLLAMVVERLREAGARLAAPGEFTRRGFLNGRIDLAKAEAVALLIGARTDRAVVLAARALGGDLKRVAEQVREDVLDLIAGLEVTLDFPEDGVGLDVGAAGARVDALMGAVQRLVSGARRGRLVHEGLSIAIVGPPNAGKSSLLNALVGTDRAIVSATPGTTRDVVEATIAVDGVPVRLLDTAGLGTARDAIDAEGMRRSRKALEESDAVIVVLDRSVAPDGSILDDTAHRPRVVVLAKADLPADPAVGALSGAVHVSALTGAGLDTLLVELESFVASRSGTDGDEGALVASLRQLERLEDLERALARATRTLREAPLEAGLVDLHGAFGLTGELLGVEPRDDVLDRIFSTFCVGK